MLKFLPVFLQKACFQQSTSSNEYVTSTREQFLFKILIIGDVGTGKSSIVQRYAHNLFTQHYKATACQDVLQEDHLTECSQKTFNS